jgi:hypothetical protein
MTPHQIDIGQRIGLGIWHGFNFVFFGLTVSPALENTEAIVRIGSGIIVSISGLVALYFTIKKNRKK